MPTASYDPRLTPARLDLAASSLRGLVPAPRYVEGRPMQVAEASAPLRRRPASDAPLETEALFGEAVTVFDESEEGWAWVQLERDRYVGYLPFAALGRSSEPTHRVSALRTHAYPAASVKTPPRFALSLGALVTITRFEGGFAVSADGFWLWASHLAKIGSREPDFVAVAERFLESPYLWGGRTSEGIDCSGLAQTSLTAAGIAAPRDSDMQAALGEDVAPSAPLVRGDLVFWKGHVGIMRDSQTLLHANGHHMKVISESIDEARSRISASGAGPVTGVRRVAERSVSPCAGRGPG
jgi:cell wall-associated NlpC family hydrolase